AAGLFVEGSAGAGNWAAVPWISVFDPAITTSATRGYYVVYLFHVNKPVVASIAKSGHHHGSRRVRRPCQASIERSGRTHAKAGVRVRRFSASQHDRPWLRCEIARGLCSWARPRRDIHPREFARRANLTLRLANDRPRLSRAHVSRGN